MYARKFIDNTSSSYKFYNTGNNYIDGLLAVKSNYASEHNIVLEVDLDVPFSRVDIDDTDLTSILGNIIDNAFDAITMSAAEKKGIVSIYTFIKDEKYQISISNNGPKIPENVRDRIFQKKFSSKSGSRDDRGFGLFIVEQLISRNKGKISVNSSDECTEFLMELCLKKASDGKVSEQTA
jgi:sensor histidine kinase regulating citrate/malate metabolism